MQILEDLWYGRLDPLAQENYDRTAYRELANLSDCCEAILRSSLNPQQQEELKKLRDIRQEMECMTECSAFITGFRLAVQMMAASV